MTLVENKQAGASTLAVIIHGFRGTEAKMADLVKLAEDTLPGCKAFAPEFDHKTLYSKTRAVQLVRAIIEEISGHEMVKTGRAEKIVLIGHSMGAVLARRVLIEASRYDAEPGEGSKPMDRSIALESELQDLPNCDWYPKVDRLIMLGSIGRGLNAEGAQSGIDRLVWNLMTTYSYMRSPKHRPTIFDFRRGSPFIVQTRLRWLDYCKTFGDDRPSVVQFLGTDDARVPPNDAIDFATNSNGLKFMQIELPSTDHDSVRVLDPSSKDRKYPAAAINKRREIMAGVLANNFDKFRQYMVRRDLMVDELPPLPDSDVNNLVFVMHGIRDNGHWTKKISARIKQKAEDEEQRTRANLEFRSRTPSYGYFPILPFLLWWYRRQKVEWLMDHYVEAKATYPEATFHYMGHSNGTYLAARALEDYPIASFGQIMFAGSVVKTNYPWRQMIDDRKVGKVLNIVATADWVVALFPYGLRYLQKLFDLGGAGHVGFVEFAEHRWARHRIIGVAGEFVEIIRGKPGADAVFLPLVPGRAGAAHDISHGGGVGAGWIAFGAAAIAGPAAFELRPEAMQHPAAILVVVALRIATRLAFQSAKGRRPGQSEHVIVERAGGFTFGPGAGGEGGG